MTAASLLARSGHRHGGLRVLLGGAEQWHSATGRSLPADERSYSGSGRWWAMRFMTRVEVIRWTPGSAARWSSSRTW